MRQTKAKKACEHRDKLKEEDNQRDRREERRGGWRETEGIIEMVSQKVLEKQVEEKGRVVNP